MILCLDAGHGGDRGARGHGLVEDHIALDMVIRIGHHVRANGCKTVYTRPSPAFVNLKARPRIARKAGADLFLSIHCNGSSSPNAEGAEAFVVVSDLRSKRVAEQLLTILCQEGMQRRGVRWDNQGQHKSIYVLRSTHHAMPAVLLELGFLTNAGDAERLADKYWRERVATAIAQILCKRN